MTKFYKDRTVPLPLTDISRKQAASKGYITYFAIHGFTFNEKPVENFSKKTKSQW